MTDLGGTSSDSGGDMSVACKGWPSMVSPLAVSGLSPTPIMGDGFGSAILRVGDEVMIGAPGLTGGTGGVYVIKGSGTTYSQEGTVLQPTIVGMGQRVGATLAGANDTLFAGPDLDAGGPEAIYRFTKSTTWSSGTSITAGTPGIKFGAAVAFDGDYPAYVGATTDGGKGAVYAVGQAGSPTQLKLSVSNGGRFGSALTLLQNAVIVGAPFEKDAMTMMAPDFGRAYVFERNFQAGSPPSFDPPDNVQGANFGAALAAKNNTLLVGVDANSIKKAVHVFRRNDSAQPFALKASISGSAGAKFGSTVALISDDTAAISNPGAGASGLVYLYDLGPLRTGGQPTLLSQIAPAVQTPATVLFGKALAVSSTGDTLYVGAPGTGTVSGRVYAVTCTR